MCQVKFELKQEHIDLITNLNFKGIVSTEYSEIEYRPAIDYKRPFGNSGVTYDVLQRLGLTDDKGEYTEAARKRAEQIIIELPVALEIIVQNKTFEPGEYEVDRYSSYYLYKGQRNLHFWQDAIRKFNEIFSDTECLVTFCMNCCDENLYQVLKELRQCAANNYMEKAVDVFEQYAVDKWISEHDGEDYCRYCDYGCETTGVRADGAGNPIYPPCADWDDNDITEHLDTDAILQDIEEEEDD